MTNNKHTVRINSKLSARNQKILKIIHLVSVIVWVGAAIVMNGIRHLVAISDNAGIYYMAKFLEAVDMQILVPGAILCLCTGLLYSLFTQWGFFKYRWIVVKWGLTIAMIALGTFIMGPLIEENVEMGQALMRGGSNILVEAYWQNVG